MDEGRNVIDGKRWREFHHSHEHEWRDFASAAGHGKDDPGEDAGQRGGEDDALDRLPLRGSAGERGFTHPTRDGGECFFGGYDDDGKR